MTNWENMPPSVAKLSEAQRRRISRIEKYSPRLGGECETEARARWLALDRLEFSMDSIGSYLARRAMLESGMVQWRGEGKCCYGYMPSMALAVAQVWIERRGGSDVELERLIGVLLEGPAALQLWEALWALEK